MLQPDLEKMTLQMQKNLHQSRKNPTKKDIYNSTLKKYREGKVRLQKLQEKKENLEKEISHLRSKLDRQAEYLKSNQSAS